jgi:hypothetical protein
VRENDGGSENRRRFVWWVIENYGATRNEEGGEM